MITRWEQGRAVVDQLLAEERVQRVASPRHSAVRLLLWQNRYSIPCRCINQENGDNDDYERTSVA